MARKYRLFAWFLARVQRKILRDRGPAAQQVVDALERVRDSLLDRRKHP